jgi:hypothetical protein
LSYNWRDSWDWDRIKKIRRKRGIGQTRFNNSNKFYAAIVRAINTRHKTLIHEMIDNYKKDGYTFGIERRKSKTGKIYNGYLYRQKRISKGKTKEHICLKAKDLDDYRDNVLFKQAKMEVYRDKIGGWASEGLTPSEMRTFGIICDECLKYRRQQDRNPVVQKYVKQLGLKVKNRRYHIIGINSRLTIKEKKNILYAIKRSLIKQDNAHKKLVKVIQIASGGDHSERAFVGFIKNAVKESNCRHSVKYLRNYLKRHKMQNGTSSPYSILKSREIKWVAEEIIWIDKKLKNYPF